MNPEKTEYNPGLSDGFNDSSEPDKMKEGSVRQNEQYTQLNYGDIVIMIWRRVKMNKKMSVDSKL